MTSDSNHPPSSAHHEPMLSEETLNMVLNTALGGGAEFAEVFAEDVERGSVHLDDGRIESLASGRDRGAGIRVVSAQSTG
ncbi:MAG: DNA gyrase modulator, partial [Acidimicrobiales bacterium]